MRLSASPWRRELCYDEPFRSVLAAAGITYWRDLPTGVLATCTLQRVVWTQTIVGAGTVSEQEDAFGDYTAGRWAWVLADVERLAEPNPAIGARGLWEWQPELEWKVVNT